MNRRIALVAAAVVCLGVDVWAQAGGAQPAQDPPSPVEQAVIEHRCSMSRVPGVAATDAYQACLAAQIRVLRDDFGVDLKRITAVERRSLDATCSRIRGAEGRDAYVRCISDQLAAMHARRAGSSAPSAVAPGDRLPAPALGVPVDPVPVPAEAPGGTSLPLVLAGAGVAVAAAAAGVVMLRKRPRAATCRNCGATFGETGDLCPQCRHAAADALRRSHMEREERERADAEERRRAAQNQEQQRQRALEQERWQREQEARAREEALAAEREAERRRQEELHDRSRYGAEGGDGAATTPHAVLGIAPTAGADEIRAAYEAAKAKYDPEIVAHLSEEVQAHFRAKAEAAERAYRTLIGQP